jgi:hypothetical protein
MLRRPDLTITTNPADISITVETTSRRVETSTSTNRRVGVAHLHRRRLLLPEGIKTLKTIFLIF